MPTYNLNLLGALEFERMIQALLLKIIGSGVSIFGVGKDGAREATYEGKVPFPSESEQWDGKWIFQAKFHELNRMSYTKARDEILKDFK